MKKMLSAIGRKNIIIISGILLIGIAVYLNLNLSFSEDDYLLEDDNWYDPSTLGQAYLVDNLIMHEDMGIGTGGGALFEEDFELYEDMANDNYFAISVVSKIGRAHV